MYADKDDKDELQVRETIPWMDKFTKNLTGYYRSWKNYEINNLAVLGLHSIGAARSEF